MSWVQSTLSAERSRSAAAGVGFYGSRLILPILLLLPPVRRWAVEVRLLWPYLGLLAFSLAFLAVPLIRASALRLGILDQPAARKVHAAPTPLLGGAAVWIAFALTVLYNFNFSRELKGVALGATIVVVVGILDDMFNLPAVVKLAGQVAGALAALGYGVTLRVIPQDWPAAVWLNFLLTILWFLTVTNAIQFLDGMDGLAAGLGAIASFFISVTALQTSQSYLMFLSAALLGACLGFLPYNFRPGAVAQVFLGDGGASFIGFSLAGLAVMGEWARNNPLIALCTPILILAVPLFDIAFVAVNRVITGKVGSLHEWLAYVGKDHIHHRFAALGLSKTESVLLIFFIAFTLGLSAILLKDATLHEAALLLAQAVFILSIVAVLESVGRRGG